MDINAEMAGIANDAVRRAQRVWKCDAKEKCRTRKPMKDRLAGPRSAV